MDLYVVRHAWAEERDEHLYPDDRLRPLTPEGMARFREFVRRVAVGGFSPSVAATSPLTRCRQTAEIIADTIGDNIPCVPLDALEPGSDLEELIQWSGSQAVSSLAWVGHAPDVEQLTAAIIGGPRAGIRFPKGAVAAIRFPGSSVHLGSGELRWLATAKLLGV